MQLTHPSNHLADAQNRHRTAERTKALEVHLIKSGHLERLVGCAVVGLTRQNEEGALVVDYIAVKIGRPLHRTLRGGKNASKDNSEGRTRTGDTRLMKPLL